MITFDFNTAGVTRSLRAIATDQMPFAIARAITMTAQQVAEDQRNVMQRHLDRPTPFTQRGVAVLQTATKRTPAAVVGFRPIQEKYLRWQIEGGTRSPETSGRALLVPRAARLNRYGNLPRGYAARTLQGANAFVASRGDAKTRHLQPGIYRRFKKPKGKTARPPKLLAAFETDATYEPIYPFAETAKAKAQRDMPDAFNRSMAEAIATAF